MRIPLATYRLQFTPAFGFTAARKILPYLSDLGISDIYASPIFKARQGSMHGYDVVDPTQLNPELGTEEEFSRLTQVVQEHEMGWLQDIVPNHMAYDGANQMLRDVLENGECSEYIAFFDIDWNHPYESIRGRVLAPFLGRLYGEALEAGEITLQYSQDGFTIHYYALNFPLRIESYSTLLTHRLYTLRRWLGEDHPDYIKFLGLLYSLKNLPVSREELSERTGQIRFIKRMLWELYIQNPFIKQFLDENITFFNGEPGKPETVNRLDELLTEQHYRLSFWKVATEEINYRRFFNINELISLRMEDALVFHQTHTLIHHFVQDQKFTGLRIDHIDGLYDPTGYLHRLRALAPDTYIIVEKILEPNEELPASWPIQGTTGYEFLHMLTGAFCNRKNKKQLQRIYSRFAEFKTPYDELVYEKKKFIIERDMAGDVDNLAHLLKRISSRDRHASDITLYKLKRAMVEVLAFFPVYCTYVTPEVFREADRGYIQEAIQKARERHPGLLDELNFMERFLLLKFGDYLPKEEQMQWIHFVMRFQQLTGPLMAKGFEDTTLYIYNRLLSLNEVGGNPEQFGVALSEWHDFNSKRARIWPHALNATSTHDTKRGEDVRARINVLSEIPEEWEEHLRKWNQINRRRKRMQNGVPVPGRNMEYFLYQTLIGSFPFAEEEQELYRERVKEYIIKAAREAKVRTTWLQPNTDYEKGFLAFIDGILKPSPQNRFLQSFLPFQKKVAVYGIWNSLSQTLLKITAPGIPDFYQGTEFWDLNLVDPDNRRPVDFAKRERVLHEIQKKAQNRPHLLTELLSTKEDGRIKLFLITMALRIRHAQKTLFAEGDYLPLDTGGKWKEQVVAFARVKEAKWALTVVPRLLTEIVSEQELPLGKRVWGDTHVLLPAEAPMYWRETFSETTIHGERVLSVGDLLEKFPVALLINEEA